MRELLDSKLERPIAFVDGDEERAILERYHEAHLGQFETVRERCAWESGYDTAALVAGDLPSVERDRHAEEMRAMRWELEEARRNAAVELSIVEAMKVALSPVHVHGESYVDTARKVVAELIERRGR